MGKKEKKRMNIKSRSRFTVKLMKLKLQDPQLHGSWKGS